jgi:hypothetical protein
MPTANPRITVTLTPGLHAILKRVAYLAGSSQSAMIGDLLQQSMPVFERMAKLLEAADRIKGEAAKVPQEIGDSIKAAQGRVEGQLGLLLEDMDEVFKPLIDEAERIERRRGRAGARGARPGTAGPARAASTPISNRGVTPHKKAGKPTTEKKVRTR